MQKIISKNHLSTECSTLPETRDAQKGLLSIFKQPKNEEKGQIYKKALFYNPTRAHKNQISDSAKLKWNLDSKISVSPDYNFKMEQKELKEEENGLQAIKNFHRLKAQKLNLTETAKELVSLNSIRLDSPVSKSSRTGYPPAKRENIMNLGKERRMADDKIPGQSKNVHRPSLRGKFAPSTKVFTSVGALKVALEVGEGSCTNGSDRTSNASENNEQQPAGRIHIPVHRPARHAGEAEPQPLFGVRR